MRTDIPTIEAEGFVFIGDPHLTMRPYGRRKDADIADTLLGKMEQCIRIANERRAIPVILGDLFDRPAEPDVLKIRLMRILKESWTTPWDVVGNHSRKSSVLTEQDSEMLLAEAGCLIAHGASGPMFQAKIGDSLILVGGTPHGQDIPDDVRDHAANSSAVIWVTHHDLAFDGAYPGSSPLKEIKGCNLVVNGHMHLLKTPRTLGQTTWYNPGNITRVAVDALDHVPAVTFFDPREGQLNRIPLEYEKNIFDLTGRVIDSISPGEAPLELTTSGGSMKSAFVDLLKIEGSTDMKATKDGSILMEEIMAKFEADNTPGGVRILVTELHREATQ